MAVRIENISDEAHQRHIILVEDQELVLTIRFLPPVEAWFIDVEYAGRKVSGVRLACNVSHIRSQNFPFDFAAQDLSGRGLDPFRIDDFSENRVALYMLEADDMADIRGQDVPV